MGLDRRTFLQQSSLALLALGAINSNLSSLATSNPRKLALLVGINEYPQSRLKGCHTDVDLQQELLIERFGFQKEDIVTLTGNNATRENLENLFREHLIKQALAGDVVVFHFSGYGSQIQLSSSKILKSLILREGIIQPNYLLLDELKLWVRSLSTDKITLVLDTSYTATSDILQGNLRLRSLPDRYKPQNWEENVVFFEQNNKSINNSFPGVILTAAQENQGAVEFNWHGLSAGLFTYSFTQSLWQQIPARTIFFTIRRAAEQMASIMGTLQQPQGITDSKQSVLPYYLLPKESVAAQGIITGIEGEIVKMKLSGLPATILDNYGVNSCFTIPQQRDILLPIRSRQGIKAETYPVKTINSLQVGQIVQESIRVFPKNLGLVIALDESLTRIEKVDATSALSNLPFVSEIVSIGDNDADCILFTSHSDTTSDIVQGGYGLYSTSGIPIAKTMGMTGEAIKLAVERLKPTFKNLLAAKLWSLTVNEYSSDLTISATLILKGDKNQEIIVKETWQNSLGVKDQKNKSKLTTVEAEQFIPIIKNGSQIQWQIENNSSQALYLLIIGLDSSQNAFAFYSPQLISTPLLPTETITLPSQENYNWSINSSFGIERVQIICSETAFDKTFEILKKLPNLKNHKEQLIDLNDFLKISRQILEDLPDKRQGYPEINLSNNDNYILNVANYASLSFTYRII